MEQSNRDELRLILSNKTIPEDCVPRLRELALETKHALIYAGLISDYVPTKLSSGCAFANKLKEADQRVKDNKSVTLKYKLKR
jgi:hypothetical protein